MSSLPFIYQNNKNSTNSIFEKYIENSINERHKNLLIKYKDYFTKQWDQYFKNNILNYFQLTKIQRSNSYIENYNKRIKDIICKYKIYLFLFYSSIFKSKRVFNHTMAFIFKSYNK